MKYSKFKSALTCMTKSTLSTHSKSGKSEVQEKLSSFLLNPTPGTDADLSTLRINRSLSPFEDVKPGTWADCSFCGIDVSGVPVHFIGTLGGKAVAVQLQYSTPKLKRSGRKAETSATESIELAILNKIAIQLGAEFGVIVYLKEASDRTSFKSVLPTGNVIPGTLVGNNEAVLQMASESIKTETPCFERNCGNCFYSAFCTKTEQSNLNVSSTSSTVKTITPTVEQAEFVHAQEGVFRVLASAGSGKTSMIAQRVIELLSDEYPEDILLISFTNKAVAEIKRKLQLICPESLKSEVEKVNIQTFNGFAQSMIDAHYKELSVKHSSTPKVMTKTEQYEIIDALMDSLPIIPVLNYEQPYLNMFKALGAIPQLAAYFDAIDELSIRSVEEFMHEFPKVPEESALLVDDAYALYKTKLHEKNIISFATQMKYAVELTSHIRVDVTHLMIDEFQDSDQVQIQIIKNLKRNNPFLASLSVIGDDSQSIFDWRGATCENILSFSKHFPETYGIELTENFRSTQEICDVATAISAQIKTGIKKNLKSSRTGSTPESYDFDLKNTMPVEILDKIKSRPYADTCILARSRSELDQIEAQLQAHGIPTQLATAKSVAEISTTKLLQHFVSFLMDETQTLGFIAFLKLLQPELVESMLFQDLASFDTHVLNELQRFTDYKNNLNREIETIFFSVLSRLKDRPSVAVISELLELKGCKTLEDINATLQAVINCPEDNFINPAVDADAVVLSTVHSAKGLEFEQVICSLNGFKATTDEELRLLFVAVTRAKDSLVLTSATREKLKAFFSTHNGGNIASMAS